MVKKLIIGRQNLKANNKKEKYEKIMEKKMATSIDSLTKGFPQEFASYLSYVRSLKFDEKPDYLFLKNSFKSLFKKMGYEMDY